MTDNFNFDEEINKRGYLNFKVITDEHYIFRIKDDDTLIEIKFVIDSVLEDPFNPAGFLSGGQAVVCYPSEESRTKRTVTQAQDLDYELVRKGEFVFRINDKLDVELKPIIIQIRRTGKKLIGGVPEYIVTVNNKQIINK